MNVNERNKLFLSGKIERQDLWPKITEYESSSAIFRYSIGLDELPKEPGLLFIRGPRQFGKSTWLELALKDTLTEFGKGSAFFLNGDFILEADLFEKNLLDLEQMFPAKKKIKRIFVDEITSIQNWERVLKRLIDAGHLRDVLIITTGSKAADLRHGSERLPGRKGKLSRTEYRLLGVSYKDFFVQYRRELGDKTWLIYMLSGGSPVALRELWQFERIPEYFTELVQDWIVGEIAKTGRNRIFLQSLLTQLVKFGGSPVGFHKLAKEAGLANNTVAAGYIEQLADLFCVMPSLQLDGSKWVPLARKPCKFHFINLAMILAFSTEQFRSVDEFKRISPDLKSKWLEWLIAQELYRRRSILGKDPEQIFFWRSDNHEIDFVNEKDVMIEVKLGKASPTDFSWFPRTFPNKKLLVINQNRFETAHVKGVTVEEFLLADGLPHPYPGMADGIDCYNNLTDFGVDPETVLAELHPEWFEDSSS